MKEQPELHKEVVSPTVWAQLSQLMQAPTLSGFRLAEGTALALQRGHRISVDLDLFSERSFSVPLLVPLVAQAFPEFMVDQVQPHGVSGHWQTTKIDLYYMGAFLYPEQQVEGVRLADIRDIAAMKLACILSRKERKDYHDIAELLEENTFITWVNEFQKKYPYYQTRAVVDHLLASSEADGSLVPQVLHPVDWDQIKQKIQSEVGAFLLAVKEQKQQVIDQREEKRQALLKRGKRNSN